jgi:hypothetical protein
MGKLLTLEELKTNPAIRARLRAMSKEIFPSANPVPESAEWISREDLKRHARPGILGLSLRPILRNLHCRVTWLWYALRCAYRSYRAHTALLLAKRELPVVEFGPALLLSKGLLIPNTRTSSRSQCVKTMLASHPWANTTDVLSYLEGFDAGERYAHSTYGTQAHAAPQDLTCDAPAL